MEIVSINDRHDRPEGWPRSFYLLTDDLGDFHDFTWNRSEGHYECTCGRTEDDLPEDAITDRLNELHPALEERSRIVDEWSSVGWEHRSNAAREYLRHVPNGSSLDGYHVVDHCVRGLGFAEPDPDPLAPAEPQSHRTGTCFDNESEEMRGACVDLIGAYLDADEVFHEVRHQSEGYHTDLVYAIVDQDALEERVKVLDSTEPLHDPLQRFRVWWYLYEYGPKTREDAIENGKYAKPSKNRKHIDWLQEHGYVAQTGAQTLTAVIPPKFTELHAVELKLRDWQTALDQASRARRNDVDDFKRKYQSPRRLDRYGYADYAWVALDAGAIDPALRNADQFREEGVGLLAITEGGAVIEHIEAEHQPRERHTSDRAWIESQVWDRLDLEEELSAQTQREHMTGQATLGATAIGGEERAD